MFNLIENVMKSKVEIRKFAVEMAVAVLGHGTPDKDVVGKASEIEKYVMGNADIPETYDEEERIVGVLHGLAGVVMSILGRPMYECCTRDIKENHKETE